MSTSVFSTTLANKLDEKLVLTGDEHKVIVATNINPKLVGGILPETGICYSCGA